MCPQIIFTIVTASRVYVAYSNALITVPRLTSHKTCRVYSAPRGALGPSVCMSVSCSLFYDLLGLLRIRTWVSTTKGSMNGQTR